MCDAVKVIEVVFLIRGHSFIQIVFGHIEKECRKTEIILESDEYFFTLCNCI